MNIIDQREEHSAAIERLLDITFGPGRHNKAVYRLREGVDPAPGLSFVIENHDGPERVGIDRARDQLRESALPLKSRADSPDWRIAEGDSTQSGSGLAATLRFWPVALPGGGKALLLGPIAVRPDLAGQGFGKGLMRHGIGCAREAGWTAILLVGDEAYYGPLGFSRAAAQNLQLPGPVDVERFLAMELAPGALAGVEGMVGRATNGTRAGKAGA
jgi:predicted N-acetyltransferase YhbS